MPLQMPRHRHQFRDDSERKSADIVQSTSRRVVDRQSPFGPGGNVLIAHQDNAYTLTGITTFKPVVFVALVNVAINSLRPDSQISWQASE